MKKIILFVFLTSFLWADPVVYVYNYDENGIYIDASKARPDPLIPNQYLLPAKATFISPPPVKTNEIPVFDGEKWVIKKDFRGSVYYDTETGKKKEVNQLNTEIPSGMPSEPPPENMKLPKYQNKKWQETAIIFQDKVISDISKIDIVVREKLIQAGVIEAMIDYLDAIQNGSPTPQSWKDIMVIKKQLTDEALQIKNKVK
jgi:hypothetical protein